MSAIMASKIRELRSTQDLTMQRLADLTNSSKSYVWELESGNMTRPSAIKLLSLAKALNVSMEFLVDDSLKEITSSDSQKVLFAKVKRLSVVDQAKLEHVITAWLDEGFKPK